AQRELDDVCRRGLVVKDAGGGFELHVAALAERVDVWLDDLVRRDPGAVQHAPVGGGDLHHRHLQPGAVAEVVHLGGGDAAGGGGPDHLPAVVVLDRGGEDLAHGGGAAVHQHGHRQRRATVAALGGHVLQGSGAGELVVERAA